MRNLTSDTRTGPTARRGPLRQRLDPGPYPGFLFSPSLCSMTPCRSPLGASGRSSGLSRYDSKPNLSTSPVMISRPSLDEGRPGSRLCLLRRGKATARRGGGQGAGRKGARGWKNRANFLVVGEPGRARSGPGTGGLGDALGEDLALDVHLGGHGDPVGVRQHGMLRPEGIGGTLVRRGRGGTRGVSFRVNTGRVEIHEWVGLGHRSRTGHARCPG